jgi:hypothetical protein
VNKKLIDKVVVSARISGEFDLLLQAYADMFGVDKSELLVEAINSRIMELKGRYGVPDSYYTHRKEKPVGKKVV